MTVCKQQLTFSQSRRYLPSPTAEHHRPLAGTKLYCFVTEAHVCNNVSRVALGSAAAGIRTRDLLIAGPAPQPSATEPHDCGNVVTLKHGRTMDPIRGGETSLII